MQYVKFGSSTIAFDRTYWYEPDVEVTESRYIILRFQPIDSEKLDVLVANIHAKSQLYNGRDGPRGTLSKLQSDLFLLRKTSDYDAEEIVIGDCNVNPYDDTLTSKDALCAHRSLANVSAQVRTRPITYRPMYNPSWHLYGRSDGALGTYYYPSPQYDAPWAVFDQAMVTDGIAYGGDDAIELVTEVGGHQLVKDRPKCIPNEEVGSDHPPVVVRIQHEVAEVGD